MWGYVHRNDSPLYFYALAKILSMIVPLLFLLGLAELRAQWRGRVGWLGGLGFIFAFFAAVAGTLYGVADVWVCCPYILAGMGGLPMLVGWLFWSRLFWEWLFWNRLFWDWLFWLLAGLALVGLASIRAKVLQRWSALPFITGIFGWGLYFTDTGSIFEARSAHIAFGVLFSISWVMIGYALWSERHRRSRNHARLHSANRNS